MIVTLWEIPAPPTQVETTRIEQLPKRLTRLAISLVVLKHDIDVVEYHDLSFDGTDLFMCTYLTSLTSEMTGSAYGKLVDLGPTELWTQIAARSQQKDIRHLMICFDDGPCYELVCTSFRTQKDEIRVEPFVSVDSCRRDYGLSPLDTARVRFWPTADGVHDCRGRRARQGEPDVPSLVAIGGF